MLELIGIAQNLEKKLPFYFDIKFLDVSVI